MMVVCNTDHTWDGLRYNLNLNVCLYPKTTVCWQGLSFKTCLTALHVSPLPVHQRNWHLGLLMKCVICHCRNALYYIDLKTSECSKSTLWCLYVIMYCCQIWFMSLCGHFTLLSTLTQPLSIGGPSFSSDPPELLNGTARRFVYVDMQIISGTGIWNLVLKPLSKLYKDHILRDGKYISNKTSVSDYACYERRCLDMPVLSYFP